MHIIAEPETPSRIPPDGPLQEPGTPPIPLHEPDPDTAPAERRTISEAPPATRRN